MDNMIHAFTVSHDGSVNKLINNATIIYNGIEYKTDCAQWDTGATNTCISMRVVRDLNLVPIGKVNIQTPSGSATRNEYRVDIKLQNENVYIENVYVIDSEIEQQGIDILIGMNIINLGDFSVSNYQGKTVFTFRTPSIAKTDYVQAIRNSKTIKKSEKTMPNDSCPCGSGKKYKKCCGKNK